MTTTTNGFTTAQAAAAAASRVRRTDNGPALEAADRAFDLLTRGPSPLSVDGAELGHGLPARLIALNELRSILLHPATSFQARDAVWRHLVTRARRDGSAWVVGCVGLALPGLKAVLRDRLVRTSSPTGTGTVDMPADLLAAFYEGLLRIDLDQPRIASRLVWRAAKAVERAHRTRVEVTLVEPHVLAELDIPNEPSGGEVDQVLEAAVRQQVITAAEADIIAVTRIDGVSPTALAQRLGISYAAVMKRRRRAEERLVPAIRDGRLSANLREDEDYASLMSTVGT